MKMSVSRMLKWLRCPRSYWYRYIAKASSIFTPANLIFGKCVDEAANEYFRALVKGQTHDMVGHFEHDWLEAMQISSVEFSSTHDEESMLKMGKRIAEIFPGKWSETNLFPLIDPAGNAAVQWDLEAPIGNGIILRTLPDVAVVDMDTGKTGVIDIKTGAAEHTPEHTLVDDQLTAQQLTVEANPDQTGIRHLDFVGYFDLIKRKVPTSNRGKGPSASLVKVNRRPKHMIDELKAKMIWAASAISQGEYPRTPMQPFDSPCSMCEYRTHCIEGKDADLVFASDEKVA